jgi:hypothetical protein
MDLSPKYNARTLLDPDDRDVKFRECAAQNRGASGCVRRLFLERRCDRQIVDKALIFPRLGLRVRQPQQLGCIHRHRRLDTVVKSAEAAAIFVDGRFQTRHARR